MIAHRGFKWIVLSEEGEILGEHETKEEAEKQLRAIEASKHRKDSALHVVRYDSTPLEKPIVLSNGYLRVDAFISRTGTLEYRKADGSKWVEYRPPDEAFKVDHIESFASAPLTNNHPPTGLLDSNNTKLYQVGTVEVPRRDGDFVRAKILVTDADTISEIKAGKRELSCGYTCDLELTPGEVDGQRYDAIQRNIRGNHVAVVSSGRAGSAVSLRIDSLDAVLKPQTEKIMKVNIDGIDFELPETAAQAVEKLQKESLERLQAAEVKATKEIEAAKAKNDAAAAEIESLRKQLEEAPAKVKAALEARATLERQAKEICGEVKADADDEMLKAAIIAKALQVETEGKSKEYLQAAFEIALQKYASEPKVEEKPVEKKLDSVDTLEAARARFYEASRNAHQKK